METITSAANKAVKNIILLQEKGRERKKQQAFVTEGIRIFLDTPDDLILTVYIGAALLERLKKEQDVPLLEKLSRHHTVILSDDVFLKAADTKTPQGILCVTRCPFWTLEDMLEERAPLLLVLEDIQDPGNAGTILRTAEAAGVDGVILSKGCVDVTSPKVVRSSMSAIFREKFVCVEDMGEALEHLKERGIRIFAAHLDRSIPYDEADYRKGTAFLIGNEGSGLSEKITGLADQKIRIPMEGGIESLNAAMSAGILVYEAYRQRRQQKK